jgi:hypothetical protein
MTNVSTTHEERKDDEKCFGDELGFKMKTLSATPCLEQEVKNF